MHTVTNDGAKIFEELNRAKEQIQKKDALINKIAFILTDFAEEKTWFGRKKYRQKKHFTLRFGGSLFPRVEVVTVRNGDRVHINIPTIDHQTGCEGNATIDIEVEYA